MKLKRNNTLLLCITLLLAGCASAYQATKTGVLNRYQLVSEQDKTFGYRRLQYNFDEHPKSNLRNFVRLEGWPDVIYEFEYTDSSVTRQGIVLYYIARDSAYTFKELKDCWCSPNMTERRLILTAEKGAFGIPVR